jgi:FKBP-type peptidyl-prolyl cis-trans isomerase
MNMKYFTSILLFSILFLSCKKGKELKTESGFRYILFTESKGPKAKIGDYLTITMIYKNENDSVLFDSRKSNLPIRFRLEKIPFKGSFEDGLTNLSEKDSARFFVPADSMYNYLYLLRGVNNVSRESSGFMPATYLTFDIKLEKIQNTQEAEIEMLMELSEKEKRERVLLYEYISKRGITVEADTSGFYLLFRERGLGEAIDSGNVVTVEYEGRLLNDTVFDGTEMSGRPYRFISGAHHVIRGWELAMKKMREGDKVTLILPSKLAYGEEGIQDPSTGVFIVQPYNSLIFDIDVISVEETPAVSSK